jgi:hypothetical protein
MAEDETTEEYASALHENISKKGNNAYYYAHGKKIDGPAWDGKEQPRLLNKQDSVAPVSRLTYTTLDSFSWADSKKSVKLYIDFENADQVEDEHISVVSAFSIPCCSSASLTLCHTFSGNGRKEY